MEREPRMFLQTPNQCGDQFNVTPGSALMARGVFLLSSPQFTDCNWHCPGLRVPSLTGSPNVRLLWGSGDRYWVITSHHNITTLLSTNITLHTSPINNIHWTTDIFYWRGDKLNRNTEKWKKPCWALDAWDNNFFIYSVILWKLL